MTSEFPEPFARCAGFDWDAGNAEKNWEGHQVSREEAEAVFSNQPLLFHPDLGHSQTETRFQALGITDTGRRLFISFTIRGSLIRVISARDMSGQNGGAMPKQEKHKEIPEFRSEEEEFEFWSTHDSADYIDWDRAIVSPRFPNLKPSTKTISLRLPESMLAELKRLANKRDVPYQSLLKIYLAERLAIERQKEKNRSAA